MDFLIFYRQRDKLFLDIPPGLFNYGKVDKLLARERRVSQSMIPEALEKIADNVLSLDESDLAALLDYYKSRMAQGEPTRSWERAVIAYFVLNGIRIKNTLKQGKLRRQQPTRGKTPHLCLVKA